jgi:hypothetical protein
MRCPLRYNRPAACIGVKTHPLCRPLTVGGLYWGEGITRYAAGRPDVNSMAYPPTRPAASCGVKALPAITARRTDTPADNPKPFPVSLMHCSVIFQEFLYLIYIYTFYSFFCHFVIKKKKNSKI